MPNGVEITDEETVNVVGLQFLSQLPNLLLTTRKRQVAIPCTTKAKTNEKCFRAIANYLMFNLVSSFTDLLPLKYRVPYHEFRAVFSGVTADMARYTLCTVSIHACDLVLSVIDSDFVAGKSALVRLKDI